VPCTGWTVPITAMMWSSGKQPVLSYYFLCSLTVWVGVRDGHCLVNLNIIKNIVAVKRGGCNPSNRPRTVVPSPSKREEGRWTPPCTITVEKGERRGLPLLVPSPSKSTPPCTVAIIERGDLLEPSPSKKERGQGYLVVLLSKGKRKERRGCNIANKKGSN
jgi:hypothetical protein